MITFEGKLEIDEDRGVLYFHDNATGRTVLRVCRLPVERLRGMQDDAISSIDVTNWVGCSVARATS